MPLSFFDFAERMAEQPALLLTVLLTGAVLLVNGWTDAPNAIAGAVVTGALSFDANGDAIKSTAYIKQAIDGGFQFYKVQNAD